MGDAIIPEFADKCFEYLKCSGGNKTEGLFRISGNGETIQNVKQIIDKGYEIDFNQFKNCDCHVVSGLLKLWLKNLPTPLLTVEFYETFISLSEKTEDAEFLTYLSALIFKLPDENQALLQELLRFLHDMTNYEQETKMNAYNLATVIGPCILLPKDSSDSMKQLSDVSKVVAIIKALIENYHNLFVDELIKKAKPIEKIDIRRRLTFLFGRPQTDLKKSISKPKEKEKEKEKETELTELTLEQKRNGEDILGMKELDLFPQRSFAETKSQSIIF